MEPSQHPNLALKRAAAYARMSTTNQKYSIENQMSAIGVYAEDHDLDLLQTGAVSLMLTRLHFGREAPVGIGFDEAAIVQAS
jgi:predicted site-specific integrase-resolvase